MSGLELLVNATDRMASEEEPETAADAASEERSVVADLVNKAVGTEKCATAVFEAQDGTSYSEWTSGDAAARCGHLSLIKEKTAFDNDLEWSRQAMDDAAGEGNLEVVKWLHAHRREGCTRALLTRAAGGGHLRVVEWCHANQMEGDIGAAIDAAAANGHYNVVDWLRTHSANKRARTGGAGTTSPSATATAAAAAAAATAAAANAPMGMFGTPFGNYTPLNGVSLPRGLPAGGALPHPPEQDGNPSPAGAAAAGAAAGAAAAGAAAAGAAAGGGGGRLRSNMLRSPELALAALGGSNTQEERQLKAVMDFRKAYSAQPLEGASIPKDPFTLFAVWFEEARIGRVGEPGAMCLSTVGPTGRPSARYVMLQGFDKRGFVWYTNFESRKSQELAHNPYGALSFWWSELQRAVRIEGVVSRVSEKEGTEYFMSRPRGSQVGAWALHQSRPVESRAALERNVKEVQDKFSTTAEVPRPAHFGGYRLRPDRVEFWKGRQSRIHDRIVYVVVDDKWQMQRLQP